MSAVTADWGSCVLKNLGTQLSLHLSSSRLPPAQEAMPCEHPMRKCPEFNENIKIREEKPLENHARKESAVPKQIRQCSMKPCVLLLQHHSGALKVHEASKLPLGLNNLRSPPTRGVFL